VSGGTVIGPASPADLGVVTTAATRALGARVSVSIDLVAAQVFGSKETDVQGTGTFDLTGGQGQAQVHQPTGIETVLFFPTDVYVRQPAGAANVLPRGKVWITAGLTQSETVDVNFPQFVLQVEDLNPGLFLGELAWGATSAAPLGPGTGAGPGDHGYLVGVDLRRAAARTAGVAGAALAKAFGYEQTALGGGPGAATPPVEVRVWIDQGGHIVKIEGSPPGSGIGTTVFTVSPVGSPVVVARPVLPQVVDIASLTPSGERENNGRGDADGA
jgi:hypothetical protein